jgi:hypothetical protein
MKTSIPVWVAAFAVVLGVVATVLAVTNLGDEMLQRATDPVESPVALVQPAEDSLAVEVPNAEVIDVDFPSPYVMLTLAQVGDQRRGQILVNPMYFTHVGRRDDFMVQICVWESECFLVCESMDEIHQKLLEANRYRYWEHE